MRADMLGGMAREGRSSVGRSAWIVAMVVVALSLVPMHLLSRLWAPAMPLMIICSVMVVYALVQVRLAGVDRLRQRLRAGELPCPRCEYPLPESEHEGLTCPECGYLGNKTGIREEWTRRLKRY